MRFDSQEHLDVWAAGGGYPAIHDAIYRVINLKGDNQAYLDLCCSTGLLGERLRRELGRMCFGLEGSDSAIRAANKAGVTMPIKQAWVATALLDDLGSYVVQNRIRNVIARRCIPELVGDRVVDGAALVRTLYDAGVRNVFLQGRRAHKNARNPYDNILKEVALFEQGGLYRAAYLQGEVAIMETVEV